MLRQLLLVLTIAFIIIISNQIILKAGDIVEFVPGYEPTAITGQLFDDLLEIEPTSVQSEPMLKAEEKQRFVSQEGTLLETDKIQPDFVNPSKQNADNNIRERIMISGQRDNHLIITTGDLIYLKSTGCASLNKRTQYIIYKEVTGKSADISKNPPIFYEPVGKLKVLEISQSLSLAKITAARGVIQKDNFIFSGKQP